VVVDQHARKHAVSHYFQPDEIRRAFEEAGFSDVQVQPFARSGFARSLFCKGLQKDFHYRYVQALLLYVLLQTADWLSGQKERGIILLVGGNKR
jgi:hypothetical protein